MKETALTLLRIAAALFPPLAELLLDLLDSADTQPANRPLADEVRAILPKRAAIHEAVAELEDKRR